MRRFIVCIFAIAVLAIVVHAQQQEPKAEVVDVCRLQADPAGYNRKFVEIGGLVKHGFEEFVLSDSKCSGGLSIWLEYGGSVNSDTVYCCGTTAGAPRGQTLVVDGITLPLVDDALFRRFDDHIRGASSEVTFRATLRGHFFPRPRQEAGVLLNGYGHFGCCSLLVIEQVVTVDDNQAAPSPGSKR